VLWGGVGSSGRDRREPGDLNLRLHIAEDVLPIAMEALRHEELRNHALDMIGCLARSAPQVIEGGAREIIKLTCATPELADELLCGLALGALAALTRDDSQVPAVMHVLCRLLETGIDSSNGELQDAACGLAELGSTRPIRISRGVGNAVHHRGVGPAAIVSSWRFLRTCDLAMA
jgi:hypothetical protein